jgi:hypothetical protein
LQRQDSIYDAVTEGCSNAVTWCVALLAVKRALQAADAAAATCLQELLLHADTLLEAVQRLDNEVCPWACDWCEMLAYLCKSAEQLQLPSNCAEARPEQRSLAQVAAGVATFLVPRIDLD